MDDNEKQLELLKWMLSDKKRRRIYIEECLRLGQQNVPTPFTLCSEMLEKLKENAEKEGKNIKEQQILVLCNVEFVEVLVHDFGVYSANITFFGDSLAETRFSWKVYGLQGSKCFDGTSKNRTLLENLDAIVKSVEKEMGKKFDVVIGNPPYQAAKDRQIDTKKGTCGTILWDQFVEKSFELCKDNGYICLVHPAGWRRPNNRSRELGEQMVGKKILYLELHSLADGLKTFGANTNYDWYVMKNCPNDGKTTMKDYSGKIEEVDLRGCKFIPNEQFELAYSFVAKEGEESVDLMFSPSAYDKRNPCMSETQDDIFKFPCVYSLPQKGNQFYYSNTDKKGHFGISKVIFSNGAASQILVDEKGEYGLTPFAYGIADTPENLPKIKKALESEKFIELCGYFRFTFDRYDYNVIKLFRKDFWKSFI